MPDTIPNPIIPSTFDANAAGVLANARSPLERAFEGAPIDTGEPPTHAHDPRQPEHASSGDPQQFQTALERARARDKGVQAPSAQQQQQQADGQQQQPQEPGAKKPFEFKRPNGRQVAKAKEWNAVNATREQLMARVQELEKAVQLGAQQPASAQAVSQAQAQAQAQDWTKLGLDELVKARPDLQKLKEERDTFYEEVKHTRVEADPEFRAKFDSRREAAIGIAKRSAGGAAEDVAKILAISDSDARRTALAERLSQGNFSDASKAKIAAAVASLDALDVEREMEIASRKATWEHTQASRQQQQQMQTQQRMGQLESEFNAVAQAWADPEKGMPFVLEDPNAVIASARQLFSAETSPRALAEGAMKAAVLPFAIQAGLAALDEVAKLREQVALLGGAYPMDNGASYVPQTQGSTVPVGSPLSPGHVQQFHNALEAARAADLAKSMLL